MDEYLRFMMIDLEGFNEILEEDKLISEGKKVVKRNTKRKSK